MVRLSCSGVFQLTRKDSNTSVEVPYEDIVSQLPPFSSLYNSTLELQTANFALIAAVLSDERNTLPLSHCRLAMFCRLGQVVLETNSCSSFKAYCATKTLYL